MHHCIHCLPALVVQGIERRLAEPKVGGSNPPERTVSMQADVASCVPGDRRRGQPSVQPDDSRRHIALTVGMTLIIPPFSTVPTTTTPSGLLVPSLTVPRHGDFVVARPEDIDCIPQIAADQREQLAAQYGSAAADALMGASLQIVDDAARQIEHDRIVAAFMTGGIAAAVAAVRR